MPYQLGCASARWIDQSQGRLETTVDPFRLKESVADVDFAPGRLKGLQRPKLERILLKLKEDLQRNLGKLSI